jgi:hypothetical protein
MLSPLPVKLSRSLYSGRYEGQTENFCRLLKNISEGVQNVQAVQIVQSSALLLCRLLLSQFHIARRDAIRNNKLGKKLDKTGFIKKLYEK